MKSHLMKAVSWIALAFPIAAFADTVGSPQLKFGDVLNLDTGQVQSLASNTNFAFVGDLYWGGTAITAPPNSGSSTASVFVVGNLGAVAYNALTQSDLAKYTYTSAATTIPASQMVPGQTVVAYKTHGGNYAKLLIVTVPALTAITTATLNLQFTTFTSGSGGGGGGGGTGPNPPTISAVQDAASYTRNVAQGSIFVVKGTNLSAAGYSAMSFPLPTTSGTVKITFTPAAGGSGTDAYLVYLYNQGGVNQLAGILPSTVPVGAYNVTVTYNGAASTPFSTQVVQRKIGLITADSTGSGLAVVQNYISASQLDIDRLTTFASGGFTFSPSKPGQVLIAWAVGMGPVTGGDNVASPGFDFTKNGVNVQVIVGGVTITPAYAGRAPGLAGADQINFTLPANVPTGCTVSFQVSVNGQLSSPTYIAIAPDASSNACVMPGFTTSQLQNFDNGGSYTVGAFSLSQFTETIPSLGTFKQDSAGGSFVKYTGFEFAGANQYQLQSVTSGACTVTHSTTSNGTTVGGSGILLDAGNVTLSGPAGSSLSNTPFTETSNSYSLNIGNEGLSIPGQTNIGKIVGGTYTVAGAGGKDVGSFNVSLTIGTPLTLTTPLPTTVVRSAGLPLSWTGGNSTDLVEIVGSTSTTTGTGANLVVDSWLFVCTTTAGAGSFTVPPSILNQLPAATLSTNGSGGGFLEFGSSVAPATFSASLTAGGSIDTGVFLSFLGIGGQASFQ